MNSTTPVTAPNISNLKLGSPEALLGSGPIDLKALLALYRKTLLVDVMPFWEKHAIDPAGGLNTCIRDDGVLINRDKWLWSQWRAVWVYSKLYNSIEAKPQWLALAKHIYEFARKHGWDEKNQGWRLLLDGDGRELRGCECVYVDAFVMYGLTEYIRATNDPQAIALARKSAAAALATIQRKDIPHFPYPIPEGARVHGIPMMFSLVLWELGQVLKDDAYKAQALRMSDDIYQNFYRKNRDVIVERISLDNSDYPAPMGTAIVPGHVIEDMWFQIHIHRDRGNHARIAESVRLIRRHLELGWDKEFGGLFLAIGADGKKEIAWNFADTKLWWPHCETLYALLLAHEITGESWCLEWYRKVHDYTFSHFPVQEHGEWTQKLDRQGKPFTQVVALPVKDPFHLPRVLIYIIQTLERLVQNPAKQSI